ncbi:type IV pilin protein [Pseudoxanthomonas sangjuensis]|uniref:type IV pilin protein n=1 Tax=Pseudoxanthomonas sangjuensis TaxID=1503750 RepID=UPI00139096FA|nr:type IV pilin protein [Pseudoxanthomonas sangjuensis]KAF1706531.1 pilus assembly protein [Pseudoxanthomonas sangjuensis]
MTTRRASGFTLIELMVVVAVIAILAAIAYPSYQQYIRKSRRSEAISALQDLQLRQERWRVDHAEYATTGELGTMPTASQYTISVTANGPTNYTLTAAPQGGQASDSCGTLSIEYTAANGIRKLANGAVNSSCW